MKGRSAYIISLIVVVFSVFITYMMPKKQINSENLKVFFIDVGQGDCSLISIGRQTLLIDGGETECWEEDINPFMKENGFNQFSNVLLSHYHSDHAGGVCELIEAEKGNRLFMADTWDTGTLKNKLSKAARKSNTELVYVSAGDLIDINNPNVKIEVLFPNGNIYKNEDENLNNDSVVLRLDYFDTSFLFTGDLEEDAEMVLLGSGKLSADVLKVGHHGSKTSTSSKFLKAVDPDYAIIEVGENNRYGHPHDSVVKRIKNNNTMIYRTDRNGDIMFEVNENGIVKIETEY